MSVEDLNKIDFMGIPENEPDAISLAISDHLAWVRTQMIICISYRKK
ncbi:DUF6572 domain-containing protein [Enterobacter quasiroggenkampii]